tara:strand:- start:495 stop:707 length:213 start_codon:yes stop_codon:yes gene_type:complete
MNTKVTVRNTPQVITVAASAGASGRLASLTDVNLTSAADGAVLQYDVTTQTWVARNILENSGLTINAGFY